MILEALRTATTSPSILASAALKVSVVMAFAWTATLLVRSISASGRHLVWTVALAIAVVLPALLPFAPAWRVPLPVPVIQLSDLLDRIPASRSPESPVVAVSEPVTAEGSGSGFFAEAEAVAPAPARSEPRPELAGSVPIRSQVQVVSTESPASSDPRPEPRGWLLLLLGVWAAGALTALAPWLAGSAGLRLVGRRAAPVRWRRAHDVLGDVAAEMDIRRTIRLVEGVQGTVPMTWGTRRPVVLLPADAGSWSNVRLRTVLRHELAHIARGDALTQMLAELARAVHWYNPLVWLAARRQRTEQERACDDRVLACGAAAADYAAELVDLARGIRRARYAPLAAMAIASEGPLRERLVALLDDGRSRSGVTRHHVLRAVLIGLLTTLPLACLRPAAPPESPAPMSGEQNMTENADPIVSPTTAALPIVAQAVRPAARARRREAVPEPSARPARVAERVEPPRIRAIVPESPAVARTMPAPPTPVTPEASRAVRPARTGPPSGVTVPRVTTTTPAPSRAASGVRVPGSVAKARAVTSSAEVVPAPAPESRLAATPAQAPDPALVVRVLRHATARGLADRQLLDLLATTIETRSITDSGVRTAYIAAAATIDSDRDRVAAIESLIVSGAAGSGDLEAVLEIAAGIGSDSQLGRLLMTVLEHATITPELRGPFLRALDTVDSDREKNRVSAELLRRGG